MLTEQLGQDKGGTTLGRHVDNVTGKWFKAREGISKLAVARHYCAWLETADLKVLGITACSPELQKLIEALKLESKLSEEAVFQEKVELGKKAEVDEPAG